jgi:CheY-like chemotaxis protein
VDGLAATEVDSRTGQQVPNIALTANTFPEVVERSPVVGISAHITKPIDLNVLLQVLRAHLT